MLGNISTLFIISIIIAGASIKLFTDKKKGDHCSGCPYSKIGNQDCSCSDYLPLGKISKLNK